MPNRYYKKAHLVYKYMRSSYIMGEESFVITSPFIPWERRINKIEFETLKNISFIRYYLTVIKLWMKKIFQ